GSRPGKAFHLGALLGGRHVAAQRDLAVLRYDLGVLSGDRQVRPHQCLADSLTDLVVLRTPLLLCRWSLALLLALLALLLLALTAWSVLVPRPFGFLPEVAPFLLDVAALLSHRVALGANGALGSLLGRSVALTSKCSGQDGQ